jgi:hypothetical protein
MDPVLLGYQNVFSHKPSHLPIMRLVTYPARRDGKKTAMKVA